MKTRLLLLLLPAVMMLAACEEESTAPNDVTSPARVTNLAAVAAGENSVTLQWTAPGDDGGSGTATSYEIRRSLATINAANFGSATVVPGPPAPLAGGTTQQFTVTGVDTLLVNHFALRAVDEAGNTSEVSNDGVWRYETTPPAQVTDLEVVAAGDNSLTLQWTAPGDDGNTGTATRYEIRRSLLPVTAGNFASATLVANPPAPALAGTVQQFTVTGIDTTVTRHFALRAFDKLDNASPVSNNATWVPGLAHLVKDIPPFKDNTIYEEFSDNSNGAGAYLFVGMTQGLNTGGVGKLRRALLAFAIADSLPAGAVVDSVRLTVRISKVPDNTARVTSLHRVTGGWGEGVSDAGEPGGMGTTAETGDATWIYRIYNTESWVTAGGDFSATVSAQTTFGALNSFSAWTSAQMTADVQTWLDTPATNHGWIVRGDETTEQSAKRFDSSEHPTAANRPTLRVYYTVTQ